MPHKRRTRGTPLSGRRKADVRPCGGHDDRHQWLGLQTSRDPKDHQAQFYGRPIFKDNSSPIWAHYYYTRKAMACQEI